MKKALMLAVALVMIAAVNAPSQAQMPSQPRVAAPAQGGFFSRLMELERRKNAALRRMIGR